MATSKRAGAYAYRHRQAGRWESLPRPGQAEGAECFGDSRAKSRHLRAHGSGTDTGTTAAEAVRLRKAKLARKAAGVPHGGSVLAVLAAMQKMQASHAREMAELRRQIAALIEERKSSTPAGPAAADGVMAAILEMTKSVFSVPDGAMSASDEDDGFGRHYVVHVAVSPDAEPKAMSAKSGEWHSCMRALTPDCDVRLHLTFGE